MLLIIVRTYWKFGIWSAIKFINTKVTTVVKLTSYVAHISRFLVSHSTYAKVSHFFESPFKIKQKKKKDQNVYDQSF